MISNGIYIHEIHLGPANESPLSPPKAGEALYLNNAGGESGQQEHGPHLLRQQQERKAGGAGEGVGCISSD